MFNQFALSADFRLVLFLYFKIRSDLGHVHSGMFCKFVLSAVSFVALVALERLFPAVRHHVALQMPRRSASVVALVTLVWLFS